MVSLSKRQDGAWRARYRDKSGREHSKHFRRKTDAQTWLDSVTVSVGTGTYADPRKGKGKVGDMAERWFASNVRWKDTTRARNRSILDLHVLPYWGRRRLDSVDVEELQDWVNGLTTSGMSDNTVRKVAGVLSGVLDYAVGTAKALGVSPMAGVKLPSQRSRRRKYLTAGQVEALADAAGRSGDVVLMLGYTGLRIGELVALRVGDVDFLRRRVTVGESATEVNGELVWSTPKDDEVRQVPLPGFLVDVLAARCEGRGQGELLFPAPRGGPLRVRNMRRDWFDAAAVEAGVPGLTPHELRHTAASLAVSAGASVLALQRMLGHSKPSVTLDVYADLFDDDLDRLAETMQSARSGARADFLRTRGGGNVVAIGQATG